MGRAKASRPRGTVNTCARLVNSTRGSAENRENAFCGRPGPVFSVACCQLVNPKYDIIIIGAGHNGLVAAAYLARAGRKVLVLERRELVGGCVVTEELWPGFKVSTASYVNSLFRPEIIRDLELKRHGFVMLPRSPSSFTPLPDGRYLLMGPDKEMTRGEVSKFSKKDADNLPRFEAMLERIAAFLEPMLLETPPNPWSMAPGNLIQLAKTGWNFRKLGADGQKA